MKEGKNQGRLEKISEAEREEAFGKVANAFYQAIKGKGSYSESAESDGRRYLN